MVTKGDLNRRSNSERTVQLLDNYEAKVGWLEESGVNLFLLKCYIGFEHERNLTDSLFYKEGFTMGLFGTIMEKLGFGTTAHAATAPPAVAPAAPSAPTPAPAAQKPAAISAVDVVGKLEGLAVKNPQKLNWKISIVDLMKLLNLDSSLTARKELATELRCPTDKMGDSAQMNTWLHKTVLQKLAANGGNIPKELLH